MAVYDSTLYLGTTSSLMPNADRGELPDRAARLSLPDTPGIGLFRTDKSAREWALKLQKHHRENTDNPNVEAWVISVHEKDLHKAGVFLTHAQISEPFDVMAWVPLDFGRYPSSSMRICVGDRPSDTRVVQPPRSFYAHGWIMPQELDLNIAGEGPVIILTGTHGSGKTTLAQQIAKEYNIPFYPSRVSLIHEQWDAPASDEISLSKRLAIQESILFYWIFDFQRALSTGGIMDRTPLDFVGYTLSSIKRASNLGWEDRTVQAYCETCIKLTDYALYDTRRCLMVAVPQFGGAETNRGKLKGPGGAYADLVESIIYGTIDKHRLRCEYVYSDELDERLDTIRTYVDMHGFEWEFYSEEKNRGQ